MSTPETPDVAAFVGATGGAGTTRTVVEVAAALAADGLDVAVVDAAFATQGLGDYVEGRIETDVTALVTDAADADLSAGLFDLGLDSDSDSGSDSSFDSDSKGGASGRVAVCPAYAPFERLARAKRVEAAKSLEARVETAASRFDHVLLDVPPIAANQAVAAVTTADRVAVVAPATERGATAIQRTHERLADVGAEASLVISTRGGLETADVGVPAAASPDVQTPTVLEEDGRFATAIERVAAAVTGRETVTAETASDGLLDAVGEYVGR
ncbi:ParA family protein [Halobellus sp. Atlit-31R]|nr:ParA family protein [Halobellus sp. Atlit-31R]